MLVVSSKKLLLLSVFVCSVLIVLIFTLRPGSSDQFPIQPFLSFCFLFSPTFLEVFCYENKNCLNYGVIYWYAELSRRETVVFFQSLVLDNTVCLLFMAFISVLLNPLFFPSLYYFTCHSCMGLLYFFFSFLFFPNGILMCKML